MLLIMLSVLCISPTLFASAMFDHRHMPWDQLLQQQVVWVDGGTASRVDYAGMQRNRAKLGVYLHQLSAVTDAEYNGWERDQKLAFLINAYNAFTVELILTNYPNVDSIKDLGSFLRSPWKKKFFTLLGEQRHLDNIEHDLIRAQFDEPLIHVAVVCASIGCPALRDRAFTAANLERNLNDSMQRFLADKSRNRYDADRQTVQVSKIFKWYGDDFATGARGFQRLNDLFVAYAEQLSDDPAAQAQIRSGRLNIEFLDYDWGLNDISRGS